MFAEVYPLTRLPRRFTFFDYKISDPKTKIGDVVRVPLKGRKVMGVVRGLKDHSEFKRISSIEEVIAPGLFDAKDMERLDTISEAIEQAPSNVFSATLQLWKPLKAELKLIEQEGLARGIDPDSVKLIKQTLEELKTTDSISIQLSREGELALAQVLRKQLQGQILIICPRERAAELTAKSIELGPVAILHGHVGSTQRRATIEAWRSGKLRTLIGTRQAVLLPAEKIDAIIITESGSDEYAKLDRNPRIDSRPAAKLLAKQHESKLIFTGALPRLEELNDDVNLVLNLPEIDVVNLTAQEERIGLPMMTMTLQEAIVNALQEKKRVLLVYNKKGIAKRLQCGACGHIPLCGTCGAVPVIRKDDLVCGVCKTEMWAPKKCPSCKSDKLRESGIGNQRLANVFANAKPFTNTTVGVVDAEHPETNNADILIVTEYYFKNHLRPFEPQQFGVIADLAFDLSLASPNFRSAEQAAYKLHRLALIARQQRAKCVVQSWMPGVAKKMLNAKKWLETELETRRKYSLPPVKNMITKLDKTAKTSYKEAQILVDSNDYEDVRRRKKSE